MVNSLRSLVALLLVLSVGGVVLFFSLWRGARAEALRLDYNQGVLLDSVERYKVLDSLWALSVGVLKLELGELKEHRAQDAQLIRDMGIRLRRVQSVGRVFTATKYELRQITPITPSRWEYRTPYIDFRAQLGSDSVSLNADIVLYDTIVQVLHRVPRFKFLGIWFGTKGVRQEIMSRNPHTVVVAAHYLEIER